MLLALALSLPASAAADPVPLAQVGSTGSGAGQLSNPQGIAIDRAGNLYVADTSNNRISEFGADGTFIRAFGWGVDTGGGPFEVCTTTSTCQAGVPGGGAGQLSTPVGVALDGAGNLYVSDLFNARISVFNTAGPSFIHAFGWDVANPNDGGAFEVCPDEGTCRPGDVGGGAGQLNLPFGVAVDGAGSLYVADQSNHRISVFGTAGPSFTHAFGWGVDTGTAAFEVCTSDCQAGVPSGGQGGQLSGPLGVALDGAGSLYVGDNGNQRIDVFGTAGPSFTRAFGWDVADADGGALEVCPDEGTCRQGDGGDGAGQFNTPVGVALDGAGNLYAVDFSNDRINVFGTAGPSFIRSFGWDVADPDDGGAFEVCPTLGPCRQGDAGSGAGQFDEPELITADCRGAVWVADAVNGRLQRFGEPATPLPPCPASTGGPGGGAAAPGGTATGQRARALKKCKKKRSAKARKKCRKKAKKLPV